MCWCSILHASQTEVTAKIMPRRWRNCIKQTVWIPYCILINRTAVALWNPLVAKNISSFIQQQIYSNKRINFKKDINLLDYQLDVINPPTKTRHCKTFFTIFNWYHTLLFFRFPSLLLHSSFLFLIIIFCS